MTTADMVFVRGGTFLMGSDRHYSEEAPAHAARVAAFCIDRTPVTNAQFRAFVDATGYRTDAERPLRPAEFPGVARDQLRAGSLVFTQPPHPVPLDDWRRWWAVVYGASWRSPYGSSSTCGGLDAHPVVHVTLADARAYARWAGKQLPTEAEWEFAARGGLDGAEYAWGQDFMPDGRPLANTWHGAFPYENLAPDGFPRSSPVGSFPPNGYGLVDMVGNVWEWTDDPFALPGGSRATRACCGPGDADAARHVIKGGSHLCSPNFCRRYRPAARQPQAVGTSTSHIGFRCVRRATPEPARREGTRRAAR